MTETTPVALSSSKTPREVLAAELLLFLPDLGLRIIPARPQDAAGVRSTEYPDLDLYDQVQPDKDYNPTALAAWVLSRVDALVSAEAFAGAAAEVEALEQSQAEMIQLAGAASTFSAMAEWHSYLSQLAPILRRNMAIAEQWDLARTLEAEAARVQGVLLALIERFPQLQAVLGEEVGRRAQGLVDPAGRDL